jgi:hypothetical protein
MIKPLEKGLDYSFQVTSVNSEHESVFSTEVGNRTLVTVPGKRIFNHFVLQIVFFFPAGV